MSDICRGVAKHPFYNNHNECHYILCHDTILILFYANTDTFNDLMHINEPAVFQNFYSHRGLIMVKNKLRTVEGNATILSTWSTKHCHTNRLLNDSVYNYKQD